ncbi:MAG: hypothetical protein ABJB69_07845 [Spartobacteria bacterium]
MKSGAVIAALLFAMLMLLGGCASRSETATQTPGGTVPGESVSGEGAVSPNVGPGGAGANVHF